MYYLFIVFIIGLYLYMLSIILYIIFNDINIIVFYNTIINVIRRYCIDRTSVVV